MKVLERRLESLQRQLQSETELLLLVFRDDEGGSLEAGQAKARAAYERAHGRPPPKQVRWLIVEFVKPSASHATSHMRPLC